MVLEAHRDLPATAYAGAEQGLHAHSGRCLYRCRRSAAYDAASVGPGSGAWQVLLPAALFTPGSASVSPRPRRS